MKIGIAFLASIFLISVVGQIAYSQMAPVTVSSSETSDGVKVRVFLPKEIATKAEGIKVRYVVTNIGKEPVYLVTDLSQSEPNVEDNRVVMSAPIVSVGGDENFNYVYTRILPGRTISRIVPIPRTLFQKGNLRISLGFGYVTDISGLAVEPVNDYMPIKVLLSKRIRTFYVGDLGTYAK